jgi:hypothetical protein
MKFGLNGINQASDDYKRQFKDNVIAAIDAYIDWMENNAKGNRFGRLITGRHVYHGESGKLRAAALKKYILDGHHDFYYIVNKVGEILRKSGLTHHSLKRYVYEKLTGNHVVNDVTHNADFEKKAFKAIFTDLRNVKSRANGISAQAGNFPVDNLPAWTLINVVQKLQLEDLYDEREITFGGVGDFMDYMLREYADHKPQDNNNASLPAVASSSAPRL